MASARTAGAAGEDKEAPIVSCPVRRGNTPHLVSQNVLCEMYWKRGNELQCSNSAALSI